MNNLNKDRNNLSKKKLKNEKLIREISRFKDDERLFSIFKDKFIVY